MTDNLKEIQDAKVIINRLLQLINEAEAKFKSARNWGVADILGGGLIVNIVKHSKIDSANNVMNEINNLLSNLQRELKDIYIPTDYRMQLGVFSTFADFFFDGAIADVYVESKIISNLNQVKALKKHIIELDNHLNQISK